MALLYDAFGREIQVGKKPETREIAVAALRDRWSTYPSNGLTPERLAAIFKEADSGDVYRQAELFEEMEEKDPHISSQLQTRKNAVLGLEYDIAPWSDAAGDKKIADFVSEVLFSLEDFEDCLLDLLDAVGKGFSAVEIGWGFDGGRAVVERLNWIHAKKCVFYERSAGELWKKTHEVPRIMTEAEPVNGEPMPPFKLVYHRYKARSGYDTRAGVLRVCGWMYLFKNYSLKDWVAFAEVFGQPLRLGKYDPGASQSDRDALINAIRSLGSDAAGIISKSTEIEFVESMKGGKSDNVFLQLAEFCDKQVSKAVLGQTATTEGTPGKLGGDEAQSAVRQDLIEADAGALAKTIRHQIIRPLVGFNFGWDKPLPWFNLAYEPPEDLKELSEVYKGLSEIGYPLTVEHISERFKVPLPEKNQTLLAKPPSAGGAAPPLAASLGPNPGDRALARVAAAINGNMGLKSPLMQSDEIPGARLDALVEKALPAAGMDGMIERVRELLDQAGSLEEFEERLLDIYGELDASELADVMEQAFTLADLTGRFDAGRR